MLVEPPNSLWTDKNADSSEYDVHNSENLKDMTMTLSDVMKPKAQGHMFPSSLELALGTQLSFFNLQKSMQVLIRVTKIRERNVRRVRPFKKKPAFR